MGGRRATLLWPSGWGLFPSAASQPESVRSTGVPCPPLTRPEERVGGGGIPWCRVGSPPLLEGVSPGSVLLGLIVLPLSQFDSSRWLLRPLPELPRPGTVLWRRVGVCSFPSVPPSPGVDGDGDHCLPFLTHRPSTRECWTSAT